MTIRKDIIELIDRLRAGNHPGKDEYRLLLTDENQYTIDYLTASAREVTLANFGNAVYVRGLIEITNYCRNDCYYCGIRRSNRNVVRYRLTKEQVLECCRIGNSLGFKTFVLQGGEDAGLNDAWIEDLISAIHAGYPEAAITLSLGERGREAYERFFAAGATRYLLRHETADKEHYGKLHPAEMSFGHRMESLKDLRAIGYQTGAGMMIGSPGQTPDNLVRDIVFMEGFRPQMIGLGPYIPQHDTPFAGEPAGSAELTLRVLAIVRLISPKALIPSTTSLATLAPAGPANGILAGANVVMPNLSPSEYRELYALYDNKRSTGTEAAEGVAELHKQLAAIGYRLTFERGDYKE